MRISYQGNPGSYAHLAAQKNYPEYKPVSFPTFTNAIKAVEHGDTDIALIPIDNSTIGRINDIHHILPETTLHITAEHYLPIQHCLMAKKGISMNQIHKVYSQVPALTQCRQRLEQMNLDAHAAADTAGAAKMIAAREDETSGALASSLAAEIYGLDILNHDMNDAPHNVTRFIAFERDARMPKVDSPTKTSLLFTVKSIPSALYHVLGVFAEEQLNLTKLESYLVDGDFKAAQFYMEVEAHCESDKMHSALKKLEDLTEKMKLLGCYPLQET